jgi:hypothetical protein
MNFCKNYSKIEIEIEKISDIINNEQKEVNALSATRNNQPTNIISKFEKSLKEKQLNLIRIIKQKIKLENKLQSVHEERFREFEKSNVLNGINDVINMVFQYAHPIDKRTKKYIINNKKINPPNCQDKKYIFTLNIIIFICIIVYIYTKGFSNIKFL